MNKIIVWIGIITLMNFDVYSANLKVDKNCEILASSLVLEASSEGKIAMSAVYEVICNRAETRHLTKEQVVLQYRQFSCWNSGNIPRKIEIAKNDKNWDIAMQIVLNNNKTDFVKGAEFYESIYCPAPYWSNSMVKTVRISTLQFWKK
jgi:hypothetical protein